MKRLAMAVLLAGCSAAQPAHDETIRVLTYNIHAGKDEQRQPSIPRIAAFIDSIKPDIVFLQEVDRKTQRAQDEDHLAQLSQLTHMNAAFAKALDFQGGEYGIGLLSRWPIDTAVTVPLKVDLPQNSSGETHEPRVALHAILHAPRGPLHVMNTHIDQQGIGTYRKQEVVDLLALIGRTVPAGQPVIFGGDLNSRPTSEEIGAISLALTDSWVACGEGAPETFPASKPDRRIDYIFFRQARCLHGRVPVTFGSDHRPYLATLQIMRRP